MGGTIGAATSFLSSLEEKPMPEEPTKYETGARKLQPATGPDPRDEFSQEAAENRKPPLGVGLTEKVDVERSEVDKSDLRDKATGPAS